MSVGCLRCALCGQTGKSGQVVHHHALSRQSGPSGFLLVFLFLEGASPANAQWPPIQSFCFAALKLANQSATFCLLNGLVM